jgi:hypothetical protein
VITNTTQRYESDGRLCGDSIEKEQSPGAAAVSLFRYEMGYGGQLQTIEPNYIKIRTSIMGRYDITEFRGPSEEMLPLMMGIAFWAESGKRHGKQHTANTADAAVKMGLNTPLMLNMMTTVMFGSWVNPALYVAAGLTPEQAQQLDAFAKDATEKAKAVRKAAGYNPYACRPKDADTIDPIIELVIDGASLEECLSSGLGG